MTFHRGKIPGKDATGKATMLARIDETQARTGRIFLAKDTFHALSPTPASDKVYSVILICWVDL